jgi:uncharacterized protein (DUF983 family)
LSTELYPPIDPLKTGIACRCPRCGNGRLFSGYLTVKPTCSACGLDYSFIDTGEGPAVLVMLVVGFVVIGSALWLDGLFNMPVWLHLFIWLPVSVILSLILLRKMKGVMIALQYRTKAQEGKLDRN